MKVEFDIELQEKDLYQFNMYHSYHRVSTWFFTFFGVGVMALSFTVMDEIEPTYTMLYWFCGLILIFYTPLNLKTTAKLRIKAGGAMTKKLHYVFSEAGITVSYAQKDTETQTVTWNQLYKVVESKKQILVYTSRVNASVLPKEQITQLEDLKEVLKTHLPSHRIKFKK